MAITRNNLSPNLKGQWSNQSLARFEELLELNRDRLGPDHPTTIQFMELLAEIISISSDHNDAKQRFQAVIEKRRKIQGPDHEDTLNSIRSLLVAMCREQDYAEAEPWLVELLTLLRDKHGSEHPATLVAMQDLATVNQYQGRSEEALKLLDEIVDTANRVLGPQHEVTICATAMRANCLVELGMFTQAKQDWRQLAEYGGSWGGSEYKPIWQQMPTHTSMHRCCNTTGIWRDVTGVMRRHWRPTRRQPRSPVACTNLRAKRDERSSMYKKQA